jgi:hypothetical protein
MVVTIGPFEPHSAREIEKCRSTLWGGNETSLWKTMWKLESTLETMIGQSPDSLPGIAPAMGRILLKISDLPAECGVLPFALPAMLRLGGSTEFCTHITLGCDLSIGKMLAGMARVSATYR